MTRLAIPSNWGPSFGGLAKRRALSQRQLGDRVGLRQETISLIETGNPATKFETLLAILSGAGLPAAIEHQALEEIAQGAAVALKTVEKQLATAFPKAIHVSVQNGLKSRLSKI